MKFLNCIYPGITLIESIFQCNEWGFLLLETFGAGMAPETMATWQLTMPQMLLRRFLSMRKFRNEGFEASHKGHQQMYLKQTNNDADGETSGLFLYG